MPKNVVAGTPFPMSFNFEDPEGDIETVILTYTWAGGGRETYSYPANPTIAGKKSGTAEGRGFMGASHYGPLTVSIAVKDQRGNQSNTLSGTVTRE
jgi:hypothetical protein